MKDELKLKILAEGILAQCNEPLMHDVDDDGNEILVCYYCERKKGDKAGKAALFRGSSQVISDHSH